MRVHWTSNAIRHLDAIYDYITQDSPVYAKRVVDRITRRSQQISDHPQSGRMVPEYKDEYIREIIESHYRIIYRIKPDQIDVLTIIHGARLLSASK